MDGKKWRLALICVAAGFLIGLTAMLAWRYYPYIKQLMQPENMQVFRGWLSGLGVGGAAVLMGMQALQVVSGFIPALPIQIAAGLSFGGLAGGLMCLAAVGAASALVFAVVKRFGKPVADRFVTQEKQNRLAFLRQSDKLRLIVFIVYLIPAMPKDVMTYIAALTPISLRDFICITVVARAPVIFCDTFASAELMRGNYMGAFLMFCVIGALGILCMLCSKKLLRLMEKWK